MKRRVLMLALFLMLGAIVNIAVAWGCLFAPVRPCEPNYSKWVSRAYSKHLGHINLGSISTYHHWESRGIGRSIDFIGVETEGAARELHEHVRSRAGLPCYSIQREQNYRGFAMPGATRNHGDLLVPLYPTWPGFAINTVFYAAVLWVLFAAPFALRRRRRIKRGMCPKCAYPVGTSDVCTECGAAVRVSTG